MNWEERLEVATQEYFHSTGYIPTYAIVQPYVFHELMESCEDSDFKNYHEINGLKIAISPKIHEPFILLQRQDS